MRRSMFACGALFAAIGLAAITTGVAAGGEATMGLSLFGVTFLAGAAVFVWVGSWGVHDTRPLQPEELRRYGRPARATVLEIHSPVDATGVQLTLRVEPLNESPFKATAHLAPAIATPRVGGEVGVKFDPHKRKHLIVTG